MPVDADTHHALHHLVVRAVTPQPLDEPALAEWRVLLGQPPSTARWRFTARMATRRLRPIVLEGDAVSLVDDGPGRRGSCASP